MKYAPLGLWLVATPFLGPFLPTTIAAGIAGSTAAHTSDRGLRGGTADTPHTPHDLQQNPPSEPINAEVSLDAAAAADDDNNYYDWYLSDLTDGTWSGRLIGVEGLHIAQSDGEDVYFSKSDLISKIGSGGYVYITQSDGEGVHISQYPRCLRALKNFDSSGLDLTLTVNKVGVDWTKGARGADGAPLVPPPGLYVDITIEAGPVSDCADCGTPPLQSDYRGPVSHTKSGLTCQSWSSQTPHPHPNGPQEFPLAGLADNNHCRNPDEDSGGAWCYTTDPDVRYQYCDVPDCADETDAPAPDGGGAYAEN